jgi:hypothetical protein
MGKHDAGMTQMKQDRREYFRIDDTVRVTVERLSPEQLEERLSRTDQGAVDNFTVMSSLATISSQMAMYMRRIEADSPDVATYLKGLDRKLEVIGRALLSHQDSLITDRVQAVNLSAGGLCLAVAEDYSPGEHVEIRMLLFPSFTGVLTYGTVVSSEDSDDEQKSQGWSRQVRIEFTHIREPEREAIIRHVLRRQGDWLRARQETQDSAG